MRLIVDLANYINKALDFSAQGILEQEIHKARKEYFRHSGDLHDDEPSYEQRIEAFSEWYLFEYLLPVNKRPPLDSFLAQQRSQLSAEDIAIYEAMRSTRRSLFEFIKYKNDQLMLRDLKDKSKLLLVEEIPVAGLHRGHILDARMMSFKNMLVIRSSVLIHPDAVRKLILKSIKKIKKTSSVDFSVLREALSLARLRCDRYRNVAPERLYTQTLSERHINF